MFFWNIVNVCQVYLNALEKAFLFFALKKNHPSLCFDRSFISQLGGATYRGGDDIPA